MNNIKFKYKTALLELSHSTDRGSFSQHIADVLSRQGQDGMRFSTMFKLEDTEYGTRFMVIFEKINIEEVKKDKNLTDELQIWNLR